MTAKFTTTQLVGGGTLVEGIDYTGKTGTTVLLSDTWNTVQEYVRTSQAKASFDAEVEQFFKPLTDAAEAAAATAAGPKPTDLTVFELVAPVEGAEGFAVELDVDGVVLRLLAEGKFNQLRWVGDDTLVAVV